MRELLPVLGIGLVIGFRHAFEPDHMAAVTTLAGRHARLREAWRLSVAWTMGHSATIALITAAVIVLGWRLPARLWPACELAVALLLVGLGISVIVRTVRGRWHLHAHAHGGVPHLHVHSHAHGAGHEHVHARADGRWALGFGLMHGLAGSGAVIALLVAATPTRLGQWSCLGAFALGTMFGMLVVASSLWGLVRVASTQGAAWIVRLRLGSAVASVAVGTFVAVHTLAR